MVIQHNMLATNANRMFGLNDAALKKESEKLASGLRVNRSSDDAAGLAISEVMRRQIRGLSQAASNAQDGISMVQAAEGALVEAHGMLQRMNDLCVEAANATMTQEERSYIQDEIASNIEELDRLSEIATFNDIKMLGGEGGDLSTPFHVRLQIGAEEHQALEFDIASINASILGVDDINVTDDDGSGAASAIDKLKNAITKNSNERAKLGAIENRLNHTIKNLNNVGENTQASESLIRDADMSKEMVTHSIKNIFSKTSIAMSAQANQSHDGVLGLLTS